MEEYVGYIIFAIIGVLVYITNLRFDLNSEKNQNKEQKKYISEIKKHCFNLYRKTFNIQEKEFFLYDSNPQDIKEIISQIINKLQEEKETSINDFKKEHNDKIDLIKNERCSQKLFRLAETIVEKEFEDFDNLVVHLECKDRPALSSAQKVREAIKKAKEFEVKYKLMKYEYDLLFELFPELENYIDYGTGDEELAIVQNYFDRTSNWLTREEYDNLSESERNQLALDRYVAKFSKSKWQIGRDYEMSIAHKYKELGYEIEYTGIKERLNDKGRDIIAKKRNEILVIQCKYWSKEKVIHEKHICQLYGTAIMYKKEHNTKKKVVPVFVTHTQLSDTARDFAQYLNVSVYENEPLNDFPRIKCNIAKGGEKIYHLPFDQQYDNTKIETKKGESFEYTVLQAELKGFRRAKKWYYN